MSKGSAIVAIIMAAIFGFVAGQMTGGGGGNEIADASEENTGPVEDVDLGDDAPERYKVPVTKDQPSKGPTTAAVTIVEFSDFECPFCGRVNPTMAQLKTDYGEKIRVVWRNQPLPFHKNAQGAAEASLEAFDQGGADKFWAYHDKLFANRQALTRPDLEKYAQELGLDVNKFKAALEAKKHAAKVKADSTLGTTLGARGTPSFFINGRPLRGAQPVAKFKEIIDDELKRVETLKGKGVSAAAMYATITKDGLTKAKPPENRRPKADDTTVYKVPVSKKDPQKGPADALVTIVEFSDYQCPFCSRVEPTVDALVKKYGKDLRVVWKNNPLPFHKDAGPAHQVAMEAHKVGGDKKFWAMHEVLFKNQRALKPENLQDYAKQVGVPVGAVKQAIANSPHKAKIDQDQALARSLGASGTPAFFINGRNLRGAQPQAAFEKIIDQELAKAKALVAKGTAKSAVYEELTKNGATKPAAAAPSANAPDPNKVYTIAVPKSAPSKGKKGAKVVIQEFSDFQCPFCGRVNPTIKQVMEQYGDKVQVVWRNYPLPFHKQAQPAAQAAVEVFQQGGDAKFWKFHDLLFANQRALTQADLEKYAQQLGGINMAKFKAALTNKTHEAAVNADMDAVKKAGARIGTPSFFINGKLLQGAQPFDRFKEAIEAALKK